MLGQRERVDLDLRGVGVEERGVERRGNLGGLLRLLTGQGEGGSDGAAVVRLETGGRIDGEGVDLLGVE